MTSDKTNATLIIAGCCREDNRHFSELYGAEYNIVSADNAETVISGLYEYEDACAVIMDVCSGTIDCSNLIKTIRNDENHCNIPVIALVSHGKGDIIEKAFACGVSDILVKPVNPHIALNRIRNIISWFTASKFEEQNRMYRSLLRESEIDEKTGVYNKQAFCRHASELIASEPDKRFIILRWDIDRFKVFNDVYGISEGDRYLRRIGKAYGALSDSSMIYGHWSADHFVACMSEESFDGIKTPELIESLSKKAASSLKVSFKFVNRFGVYHVDDPGMAIEIMCDRALLALRSIKGSYTSKIAYYVENMRAALIEEQEIISDMKPALENRDFLVYYQPQYNYSTNKIHGAEALVRWNHPVKGLISPAKFIPVFEKNGFITSLDEYVWEQACAFLRNIIDDGITPVPISVNVSRIDIYNPKLCQVIIGLVEKYGLERSMLRLEITESAYMDDPEQLVKVVNELREAGFEVEMDDFGSGYSSLNTLKDVPVDILKLDMKFLQVGGDENRSGSILSSVIRMVHWIKLPVIAEGVEDKEQADYLKSIGCIFMQGYYFARPMKPEDFRKLLIEGDRDNEIDNRFASEIKGAENFLNPSNQETLLFNSFVGGAAILEYDGKVLEALRVNEKFFDELGISREKFDAVKNRILDAFGPEYRRRIISALEEAAHTGEESLCELCCRYNRKQGEDIWIRVRFRFLASSDSRRVYYAAIDNISQRFNLLMKNTMLKTRLSALFDNVPGGIIYFRINMGEHRSVDDVYFNDMAAKMLGYEKDEYAQKFITNTTDNSIHPDDLPIVWSAIETVQNGENAFSVKYRSLCKDKSWRWVHLTGKVMRRTNDALYVNGILLDIDKNVRGSQLAAKQAAEMERQRIFVQSLYDTIPCGIIQYSLTDGKLKPISFNESAWQIFGYDSRAAFSEMMKKYKVTSRFYHADREQVLAKMADIMNNADTTRIEMEHRINRPDGSVAWLHLFMQKITYGGVQDVLQCMFNDITALKQEEVERMAGVLIGVYDDVFEFDPKEDTCTHVFSKETHSGDSPSNNNFTENLEWFAENRVHPEDRAKYLDFYRSAVAGELAVPCTCEYRYYNSEKKLRYGIASMFGSRGSAFLNCCKDITDEKTKETK
ncbi:MAG: EAL domain-containing protein [Ruminiclostridium sp.]